MACVVCQVVESAVSCQMVSLVRWTASAPNRLRARAASQHFSAVYCLLNGLDKVLHRN